jgi:bifunctional non-homologous end joining protein LigD
LTGHSILERRKVLERILKPRDGVQLGSYVEDEGKALFSLMKEKGVEGIIAKRKDSIYRPGKRTSDWLKIKARLQQEFVVGGFTAPKEAGSIWVQSSSALIPRVNSGITATRAAALRRMQSIG